MNLDKLALVVERNRVKELRKKNRLLRKKVHTLQEIAVTIESELAHNGKLTGECAAVIVGLFDSIADM
jgi:hypothetical protein